MYSRPGHMQKDLEKLNMSFIKKSVSKTVSLTCSSVAIYN